MKFIFLSLLVLYVPLNAYCRQSHIDSLKGADMTFYKLYCDTKYSDTANSMGYLEIFLSGIDTSVHSPAIARMYDELSEYYEKQYIFSKAIDKKSASLRIYNALGDVLSSAECQYKIGIWYYEKGLYHKSLEYADMALRNFTKNGNKKRIMDCWNLMGTLFFVCNDMQQSEQYFKKYEQGAIESSDSTALIKALGNRAILSDRLKDTAKTMSLSRRSLELSRTIRDTALMCRTHLNLSALYWGYRDLDSSEFYLDKARPLLRTIKEKANWHLNCGLLRYSQGRNEEAVNEIKSAISHYQVGEFDIPLQKCLNLLNIVYKDLGDIDSAYAALFAYFKIDFRINRNNIYLELFNTRNEIILQQEREAAERKESRMLIIYLTILASLVITVLIAIMLLLKNKYKLREKEQVVKAQEDIIELKKMQQYNLDVLSKKIISSLENLKNGTSDAKIKEDITDICIELQNTKNPEEWKEINRYIPDMNSQFYQNLIKAYPSLTVNERRLCMLIHQNLSTKEISEITRQSPHSINIARTRLRNKLELTGKNISLPEFLSKFD